MKRFWEAAAAVPAGDGWAITLDGRPLRTPARAELRLPAPALAQAIAAEWAAVADAVRPGAIPLTGLANAAVDIVAADPDAFAASLASYGESDLTCYRADGPQSLVARQVAAWEPPLKAVEARHGLLFRRTAGVMHVAQPADTIARLHGLLKGLSAWKLAPLQPLVTLSGSVVLGLSVLEGLVEAEAAFAAAHLDDLWQAEQWGTDRLAEADRAGRWQQFEAAARFVSLLD
ncbi:MAG: ATP12 family chaperone protein [Sandaracinobacter sp.]